MATRQPKKKSKATLAMAEALVRVEGLKESSVALGPASVTAAYYRDDGRLRVVVQASLFSVGFAVRWEF